MGRARIWKEQWHRVLRWYERIQDQNRSKQEYEDYLWAFFQNCWHMKDWLLNDPVLGRRKDAVKKEVHCPGGPLMICRDLANRSKHLKLVPARKNAGKNADVGGRVIHETTHVRKNGTRRSKVRWDYWIIYNGGRTKALPLADEAIKAWKAVFAELGVKL